MEAILKSLKSSLSRDSFTEQGLPYYELHPTASSGGATHRPRDRSLTHLSDNPSQFEKDLRSIVLDLYSDRGPSVEKEPARDVFGMDSNSNGSTFGSDEVVKLQGHSTSSRGPSLQGSLVEEPMRSSPILFKYEETALMDNLDDKGPRCSYSFSSEPSYKSDVQNSSPRPQAEPSASQEDECQGETTCIKNINELRRNLSKFALEDAPEIYRHRYGSSESDYIFSDSGIHLELLSTDNDLVDSKLSGNGDFIFDNKATEQSNLVKDSQILLYTVAHLEGKIETLTTEYDIVLEERKELQAKMKVMENKAENDVEKDAQNAKEMRFELEKLREKELNLENKRTELQRHIDDKDVYVTDIEQKLKCSQSAIKKLEQSLATLEAEVSSKTNKTESLREELKNLNRILLEVKVQQEEQFKEKQVLVSDVSTLQKAKTWFSKQLEIAKQAQVNLRLELSEYESTVFSQKKHVEQLKCENARANLQLTESQGKALGEKAKILEYLERVEDNLVNQSISFRQTQVEKETVQKELTVKIHSLQYENNLLKNLSESAKNIEGELDQLKNEARLKTESLRKLQEEKAEVIRHLKVSGNVNDVSEKKIKALELKLEKNEHEIKMLAGEREAKDACINQLRQSSTALEESIQQAQEEKDALDSAVQLLRLELDKVERRFKMMKRELTTKTNQLEEVTRQKDVFISELRALRDEMEKHKTLLEQLRDSIRLRDETIRALENGKAKLLVDVRALSDRLRNTQTSFEETQKERDGLREQLKNSSSQRSHLEQRMHESFLEKAKLEGELEITQQASRDNDMVNRTQNQSLQNELEQLQTSLQHEVTRHRDEAINLEQEVEFLRGQLKGGRNMKLESELGKYKEKLAHLEESKKLEENELRKELKILCDSKVNEARELYEKKTTETEKQLVLTREEKDDVYFKYTELTERAKNTADLQNDKIIVLQRQLQFARKVFEEQRAEMEKLSINSVELEREKGRLSGLMSSQKTLRDHCVRMEQSAAKQELKIFELHSSMETLQKENELQRKEVQRQVSNLQSKLTVDTEQIQELQDRLQFERKENSQLRVRLNDSEEQVENVLKKLATTCLNLESTSIKHEKCEQELQESKESQKTVRQELSTLQMLVYKLESELKILKEKDEVKDDLAASLEWKLKQRCKEAEYAKQQLRMADERHQIELENLRTACQVAKSEASYLRKEVTMARKSKCENQDKFFTTRDEILTTRQETESVKQELFAACQHLRYLKAAILNSCDVTGLQEFVRDEQEMPLFVAKTTAELTNQSDPDFQSPLIGLRDCIASLRDQISSLQEQMNQHTDAVCTTASSWRSFEQNVQSLQNGCGTVTRRSQHLSAEKDTTKH